MPRVIHTAQALVDEVLQVAALPRRGQNAVADSLTRYPASAVNVLLAAARSGGTCVQAGSVGTGANGDLIRETLSAEQIEVSSPPVPDLDTGTCVVLLEPSAERTFITTQGAERRISVESLQTSDPQPGDLVCVSGYSFYGATRDPLLAWLETLPEGVLVVLDPGAPYADLPDDLLLRTLALTDVWTGNAEEAEALAARLTAGLPKSVRPKGWEQQAAEIAEGLHADAVVIVRDGPKGCVVRVDDTSTVLPGYPQKPIDTNGAGDTHTGVLVAEAARGTGWVDAARRANAAGAIKVTRKGPNSAPTAAEIDSFLTEQDAPKRG